MFSEAPPSFQTTFPGENCSKVSAAFILGGEYIRGPTFENLCMMDDLLLNLYIRVAQCGAKWNSVLECGAACCSVLQCVAVWCSVLQCFAV